jgi:serine/threonine protein kinase
VPVGASAAVAMGVACTTIGDRCGRDRDFFTDRAGARSSLVSVVPKTQLGGYRRNSTGTTSLVLGGEREPESVLQGTALDDLRAIRRALRGKKVKLDDFQILETVGKGGFGRVRVIKPREKMMNAKSPRGGYDHGGKLDLAREDSSRIVKLDDYATCVKLMNKVRVQQSMNGLQLSIESLRREVMILSSLEHPLIINLVTLFHDEKRICIIYEYVNGGELRTYLDERVIEDRVFSQMSRAKRNEEKRRQQAVLNEVKMQEQQRNPHMLVCDSPERFFVADIVLMMEYLQHETKRIVYRDMKPENVIIHHSGHLKLIDFGFAKVLEFDQNFKTRTVCGTLEYQAPEMLLRKSYNETADWWSVGCLVYEIYNHRGPFHKHRTEFDIQQAILANQVSYRVLRSKYARDLIRRCLTTDPGKRAGSNHLHVKRVKDHKLFHDISWLDHVNLRTFAPFKPNVQGPFDTSRFARYEESMEESAPELSKKDNRVWDQAIQEIRQSW